MKRLLVIGGGLIGRRHVEAVQAHPGCTLVGLVDPDPTVTLDVPRWSDMAAVDMPVDGAIIATPTHLHATHGVAAAKRGWDILIEKPVAGTLADAKALTETLVRTGTHSLVGHHRRYHASVNHMRDLIAEGRLGRVVTASLIWAMRKPDAYFNGNWRTAGGSPVMINLVHDIDLLRYCLGDIDHVAAIPGTRLRGADRLESGAVALGFANGATGTISFADTTPSPWGFEAGTGENPNVGTTGQDMLWITGTRGALSFPSLTLWQGKDWGQAAEIVPLPRQDTTAAPLIQQLSHFIEVMNGAPAKIDVADAAKTLAVALEIEQQLTERSVSGACASHRTGQLERTNT